MWHYKQNTGRLYDATGELVATGYAGGNQGKDRKGVNNHLLQAQKQIGPLPCGVYTMCDVIYGSALGPFAIKLDPDPTNQMFGRGGFFMHGDTSPPTHSASEGCIIMARAIRELCWNSKDHQIVVELEGN